MSYLEQYEDFLFNSATLISSFISEFYYKSLSVSFKQDRTPVTELDIQLDYVIRDCIRKTYPSHSIMSEELPKHEENSSYKWVIDPIDGTKSFIAGVPLFGVLVALLEEKEPVLGMLVLPMQNKILIGDNMQAYSMCLETYNKTSLTIRTASKLSESIVSTSDVFDIKKHQSWLNFSKLLNQIYYLRTWGDCFGYYLLLTGKIDIMLDPIVSDWDKMALIPIIRGAKGVITDWNGNDILEGNSVIATSKELHSTVLSVLNS